jgi:hypothetical protein
VDVVKERAKEVAAQSDIEEIAVIDIDFRAPERET